MYKLKTKLEYKGKEHIIDINRRYTEISDWSIRSDIGFDVIDSITLSNGWEDIVVLPYICLYMLNILENVDINNIIKLPIPKMYPYLSPYCDLRLYIKFYKSDEPFKIIKERKDKGMSIISESIIDDLTNVIFDYIGVDDSMYLLYQAEVTIPKGEEEIYNNPNLFIKRTSFNKYHTVTEEIYPSKDCIEIDIHESYLYSSLLNRIIIMFYDTQTFSYIPMEILEYGNVHIKYRDTIKFTPDSSLLSEKPLYIIEFDNRKDIKDKNDIFNIHNKSAPKIYSRTKSSIYLKFTTQKHPINVSIILETRNLLSTNGGFCGSTCC